MNNRQTKHNTKHSERLKMAIFQFKLKKLLNTTVDDSLSYYYDTTNIWPLSQFHNVGHSQTP